MCCFWRFIESNREFVVHDVDQEPYASLAVLPIPNHARVLSADCTRLRGDSNALASALVEIEMLFSPSAIAPREAICWHRNSIS
jgi:hypothetical protein